MSSPVVGARRVDIRPLSGWLSVFNARRSSDFRPAPRSRLLPGWSDIPTDATDITVLVHGFNVTLAQALEEYFPSYFKRLYWVGTPVLSRQGDRSIGYAHTVAFTWPGNQGIAFPGPIDELLLFPEDEFHALQTGIPLRSLLLSMATSHPRRRLRIIAHSLGNMVVNSALMDPQMDGVVDTYVMNDAALPADSFDAHYAYSPAEREEFERHAAAYGYPDDAVWQDEWRDMNAGRPFVALEPGRLLPDHTDLDKWRTLMNTFINPALFPKPEYHWRWRQNRSAHTMPEGVAHSQSGRGPWRAYFADNLARTRIINTYNETDRVLGIGWTILQRAQKPNIGPAGIFRDNRKVQFWGLLRDAGADQEYLWDFRGSHAHQIRQWAELAHWFPALANATGRQLQPGMENRNVTSYGGGEAVESHTFMTSAPFPSVWGAFEVYRDLFKE
jgi:hypothetical protein